MANAMRAVREDKAKVVAEVRKHIDAASSMVLLGFKGMDVVTVTDLRARFRKAGVTYTVVKNKLLRQALKGTSLEGNAALEKVLTGETAVAFSYEDPAAAAKVIRDFRKEGEKHEKLQVKAGVLETTILSGEDVESRLAAMPGKDELRAQLLATLAAPMQNLLQQLAAPAQNLAFVLEARRRRLEEG